MVFTLTTVIFTIVRRELACGHLVLLAFLCARLSVSKISFLWSRDFLAILRAMHDTWLKKIVFIVAIVLCLLPNVMVGPASAVGLIPIDKEWEGGGAKILVNATAECLFPDILSGTHTYVTVCNVYGAHEHLPSSHWQVISDPFLHQLA